MTTAKQPTASPRIALIGAGAIAELFYLPALKAHPDVLRNLTLVDTDIDRANKMAAQFNVPNTAADYRDIVDQIDGAILAVPSHLHHPLGMDLLGRGIHLLCEKPLAENPAHAAEMVAQADATGAALLVNLTRRLYASFQYVKRAIDQKTLGELRSIQYVVGEEFKWPTISGFYFNPKTSPRGVLLDRGAHVIDLICWWLGAQPELIDCHLDSFGGRETVTQVRFQHGACSGEVMLSLLAKLPCTYRVAFERGVLEGDIYDYQTVLQTGADGRKKALRLPTTEHAYEDIGKRVVQNFIGILRTGEAPLVAGRDVLDGLRFIDTCYTQAAPFIMPWYTELPELKAVGTAEAGAPSQ